MKPVKCVCGANEQHDEKRSGFTLIFHIKCPVCGWSSAWMDTKKEAVDEWNTVMSKAKGEGKP